MDIETRKTRLHTLVGYFLTKYDLSHHSCNHICFNIKPEDVKYIVDNYCDILDDSNIYISPTTYAYQGYSFNEVKVEASDIYFSIKSKVWDRKNHFETNIRMDKAVKIELDISCEVILSLHFSYPDTALYDQISFRKD